MYFCSICVCACVREWVILVLGFTTSEMFFPLWHDVYMMKTIIGYGQVPMKPLFSHSYTDRTSCIFVPFMRVFLFHLCVCVCEWVREILVLGFTTSEVFFPFDIDVYMMKTIIGHGQAPMKPLFCHSYTDRTSCIFVPFVRACVCEWEILWFWVSPLVHDLIIETYKEERCLIAEVFHKGIWVCSLYTWTVMRSHSTNLNYK